MLKLIRKITSWTKSIGLWIAENSVEIIWCIISVICAGMAVALYRVAGEFINTFGVFNQ
jgi:hypothetical protein